MRPQDKRKLAELTNTVNGKKRKSTDGSILLFIAHQTAETNGNVRWLVWVAGIGIAAGLGTLITLAIRGL